MGKEDFIKKHANELTGFCLEAFMLILEEEARKQKGTDVKTYSAAMKGEFMLMTMKRVRDLLARLYDDCEAPRTLDEVKTDAKLLGAEDRIKLRSWIETMPKSPSSNGVKT